MVRLFTRSLAVFLFLLLLPTGSLLFSQGLRLELTADRAYLDAGDPVYLRLDITNESDEPTKIVPASLDWGHFELQYHTQDAGLAYVKFFDRGNRGFGSTPEYSVPLKPHQTVSYYYFRPLLYYRQMNANYWEQAAKGADFRIQALYRPYLNRDVSSDKSAILIEATVNSVYVQSITPKDQALLDLLSEGKDKPGITMRVLGLVSGKISLERAKAVIGQFDSNERNDLLQYHLLYYEAHNGTDLEQAAAQRKLDAWLEGQSEIKRNCLKHALSGMSEAIYRNEDEDLKGLR